MVETMGVAAERAALLRIFRRSQRDRPTKDGKILHKQDAPQLAQAWLRQDQD